MRIEDKLAAATSFIGNVLGAELEPVTLTLDAGALEAVLGLPAGLEATLTSTEKLALGALALFLLFRKRETAAPSAIRTVGDIRQFARNIKAVGLRPENQRNGIAWGSRVDDIFLGRLSEMAADIGLDPSDLMTIFYTETGGTFGKHAPPWGENKSDGGGGLIGWTDSHGRPFHEAFPDLAKKTAVEQLPDVAAYLRGTISRFHLEGKLNRADVGDVYLLTRGPAWVGAPDSTSVR